MLITGILRIEKEELGFFSLACLKAADSRLKDNPSGVSSMKWGKNKQRLKAEGKLG